MPAPSLAVSHETDVAVVGAGAAGLYAALCAAREHASVVLISATPLAQTASYWAQGGLAAALAADDSAELHLRDTELAGRGLVRRTAAEILTREAPDCVRDLQSLGVRFDADGAGRLALGLEGGHSCAASCTPAAAPPGDASCASCPRSSPKSRASPCSSAPARRALWRADGRCAGLICEDGRIVAARAVVVGTGGAAAMWARTTNPPGSQGVGLLLAHQAGAGAGRPGAAAVPSDRRRSASPGARAFSSPRRSAARARRCTTTTASASSTSSRRATRSHARSHARLQESGESSVGLDMRAVDPAHFPNVVAALREAGLDPSRELVPVAPAAHYMMGGIVAGLHAQSTLAGLYAVGESSCTGLHGANRLASNSLSECFVFARRAVAHALARALPRRAGRRGRAGALAALPAPPVGDAATRQALWRDAGIVRSADGLSRLLDSPHPLVRAVGALRAGARGEPRRAPALRLPQRDPALDGRHVVVAGAGRRRPAPKATPQGNRRADRLAELELTPFSARGAVAAPARRPRSAHAEQEPEGPNLKSCQIRLYLRSFVIARVLSDVKEAEAFGVSETGGCAPNTKEGQE